MNKWQEVWSRRELDATAGDVLQQLIYLDGFDAGAGHITADRWLEFVALIGARIGVQLGESLYEVGCGGGALLYPFYKAGHRVAGCDFTAVQVSHAAAAMPGMAFEISDAASITNARRYDHVLANAVFHYFPDLAYAEEAVARMLAKAKKTVAILDVPDAATEAESERARAGALSAGEYARKYEGLSHLYYRRAWFKALGADRGYAVETFDQVVRGYGNNAYRFNCIFRKTA